MEDGPRRVKFVPVKGGRWRNENIQGHISVPATGKRWRGQTEHTGESLLQDVPDFVLSLIRRNVRPRNSCRVDSEGDLERQCQNQPFLQTEKDEAGLLNQELPSVVPLINWEDVLDEAELLDLAGPEMSLDGQGGMPSLHLLPHY